VQPGRSFEGSASCEAETASFRFGSEWAKSDF